MDIDKTSTTIAAEANAFLVDFETKENKWLRERYPLLTPAGLRNALTLRYKEQSSATAQAWTKYKEIRWSVIVQGRIQMEKLALVALEVVAGSEHARSAIADFLLGEAQELPEELQSYCVERSALTVVELAPRVIPPRLLTGLALGLTRYLYMPETARTLLLQALQILIKKRRKPGWSLSLPPAWQLILETLELEGLRPPYLQSPELLKSTIVLTARFPHHSFVPLLKVIAESHHLLEIRSEAATALRTIGESLEIRWLDTREDQVSNLDARAERLAALTKATDHDFCIQSIFNNTKGIPIDSAFDPRAGALKRLLEHSNVSVRMAACWALFGQGTFCPLLDDFTGGINALACIAVSSQSPGLTRDAIELLERLREDFPEIVQRIEKAEEEASKRFVEEQLAASSNLVDTMPTDDMT